MKKIDMLRRGAKFRMFLLGNKYTSPDELAAAFVLAQMITDQTQVEEETRLHLIDLSLWHSPCSQVED